MPLARVLTIALKGETPGVEVVEPVMAAVAILLSADHVRRTTEYTRSCALSQHNLFSLIVFSEKYL